MSDQPLKHLPLEVPPWSRLELTVCGRMRDDVAAMTTVDEATARIKRDGKQRAYASLCMTCIGRVHSLTWETNPQETTFYWVQKADSYHGAKNPIRNLVLAELKALAALVRAHPDEWAAHLEPPENVVGLHSVKDNET